MSALSRFLPSSFDAQDPTLHGVEVPATWRWNSLEPQLKTWGSKGIMMRLPLFWQLETLIFEACHTAEASLFINDRANMPLGAAALKIAEIDTVVTDLADAEAFVAYLTEAKAPLPSFWFIVRTPEQATTPLSALLRPLTTAEETHRSPGIPA